jgi:predicted nucleic acid-binding protein
MDTMALIWGMQGYGARSGNPAQADLKEMQYRTRVLLELLMERKDEIVLASVTVSEFLIRIPPARHKDVLAKIDEWFTVHPFDLPACALAASLWPRHKAATGAGSTDRKCIMSDVLIVATAKFAGATVFYSHDAKCRKLADSAGMKGEPLPLRHPELFRDKEIREKMNLPPR